jgi:Zn finger protein HypA/HybF involved in hydrogenase expression
MNNIFQEDKGIPVITFFYFECKECRERWFSTFGFCPRCKKIKFKILDDEEAHAHFMEQMFSEQIHYVFLNREK